MTEVKINGKEASLVMNMRGLRDFGRAMGVNTPTEASKKIMSISVGPEGVTFDTFDIFANLIYTMSERGGSEGITLDDCYDAINDVEVINAMMSELESFLPSTETVKKKEEQKTAEVMK